LGIQDVPSLVYRLQRASANIASTLVLRVADVNALLRGMQSPLIEKRWSVAGRGD
jgi:hypothetical protein